MHGPSQRGVVHVVENFRKKIYVIYMRLLRSIKISFVKMNLGS